MSGTAQLFMTCSAPPPLTPDQLSDALDGTATAAIHKHLEHCAFCSDRLADARGLEQQLSRRLYRWDCPPPQQLTDFQLGLLDAGPAADISAHVAGCARCQPELAALQAFLADELAGNVAPPERKPRPGWRDMVAQLLPPVPAPALRGEARAPFIAQAGDVLILLDAHAAGEATFRLVGQLASPDPAHWAGALVQLWHAGTLTHTAIVDELANFQLAAVRPGRLELRITPPKGAAIILPPAELGELGSWQLSPD